MESIISIFILTFIIVFLVYDFIQKRKNIKQQNDFSPDAENPVLKNEPTNDASETSKNENAKSSHDSNDIIKNNENFENLDNGEIPPVELEIDLINKIQQIEKIVELGLYGGGNDYEKCLHEIKNILNKK